MEERGRRITSTPGGPGTREGTVSLGLSGVESTTVQVSKKHWLLTGMPSRPIARTERSRRRCVPPTTNPGAAAPETPKRS